VREVAHRVRQLLHDRNVRLRGHPVENARDSARWLKDVIDSSSALTIIACAVGPVGAKPATSPAQQA
jgi:hypothetical protein